MSGGPAKGMKYLHMGPWPGFVGLCFDEKVFRRELKRLNIHEHADFVAEGCAAAMHHFVGSSGANIYLLALGLTKGRTKEQVAGLVAHEAVHIIQGMSQDIANGKSLGVEAEAYLVQMIVQEALQSLWKSNKVRQLNP